MPNELTELTPHINEMRTKLSQTAEHERSLTQALSNELKRMDEQTLRNVRRIGAEHEARRTGIFNELEALAASSVHISARPRATSRRPTAGEAKAKLSR